MLIVLKYSRKKVSRVHGHDIDWNGNFIANIYGYNALIYTFQKWSL